MPNTSPVTDNTARQRFELKVGEYTAYANYQRQGNILVIPHVEAPPALRGTGAAGLLMRGVAEQAANQSLTIRPLCSYAAAWLQRHPEYAYLVA